MHPHAPTFFPGISSDKMLSHRAPVDKPFHTLPLYTGTQVSIPGGCQVREYSAPWILIKAFNNQKGPMSYFFQGFEFRQSRISLSWHC